jgi:hypothetical protein
MQSPVAGRPHRGSPDRSSPVLPRGLGLDRPAADPHAALYRACARQKLTATVEQAAPPEYQSNATYQPDAAPDVPQQFDCLDNLWENESGWSPTAQNAGSTAYGIAQTWTLMGVAKTSDPDQQIDAGLAYVAKRYGTPCDAWAFWQEHHWYRGTSVAGRETCARRSPPPAAEATHLR